MALETIGGVTLNDNYWDCECETKYIHPKYEEQCKVCCAMVDEQPDSHADEVKDINNHA